MKRLVVPAALLFLAGLTVPTAMAEVRPAVQSGNAVIVVDPTKVEGPVGPLLFGANHRWVANAAGSADPATGLAYPSFVAQVRDIGVSTIRYPAGTLGNLFRWERAVGPNAQRGLQASGLLRMPTPFDSRFGPDEYGDLLDRTGATGDLVVNFATGTAAEAANFVAYMTAPAGSPKVNGVDWAVRRAANGHSAPYSVSYAEVGNEWDPAIQQLIDQNYWIRGDAVRIDPRCAKTKISCLYAFGGDTRFTDQPLVRDADWREPASVSTGEAGQVFNIRYGPVIAGSETIQVDGQPWRRVANLSAATVEATVYAFDPQSGAVRFGGGGHGKTPSKGARITATYTSGPHEGFVDYYRAIKAANPRVKVCSSVFEENFVRIMGTGYAYDCLQQHPYIISNPVADGQHGLEDFFVTTARRTIGFGDEVAATQASVVRHAGGNAPKVSLLLSEYGELGVFPAFAPHFARSEGQAVMNALAIREWVLHGITAANRTVLTDYTFAPIPPSLAAVQAGNSASAGDFAIIGGPGPNSVITPAGLVMKMLRRNLGDRVVSSHVSGAPRLATATGPSIEGLQVLASKNAAGDLYLWVINVSPSADVSAMIDLGGNIAVGNLRVEQIATNSINDENSPEAQHAVDIVSAERPFASNRIDLRVPKHSVTTLRITRVGPANPQ